MSFSAIFTKQQQIVHLGIQPHPLKNKAWYTNGSFISRAKKQKKSQSNIKQITHDTVSTVEQDTVVQLDCQSLSFPHLIWNWNPNDGSE